MTCVLYTGAFRFPEGDAAAARVYAVGQLFKSIGCTVAFAGWERAHYKDGYYRYKDHDCYSQAEFRERELGIVSRLFGFFLRGFKTLKWLRQHRQYDVVVAYNPPALFSLGLLLSGRVLGFRVVLDCTEWYEGEHLPGGRFGLAAAENWTRMRLVYPLFRHVICISRLLEHHFSGRNVVNIPPLMIGTYDLKPKPPIAAGVCFVYAGEAGKKDRLLPFIQALPEVQKLLQRPLLLRIAGLKWDTLCQLMQTQGMDPAAYQPFVECLGRIDRESVRNLYSISHFSIIFREDKRYARAGFPTKAVESWSYGCPIITNPVGDLGALARDMVDTIVVDEISIAKRMPEALREIIAGDYYPGMSAASSAKANQIFTPNTYRRAFATFVEQIELMASQKS